MRTCRHISGREQSRRGTGTDARASADRRRASTGTKGQASAQRSEVCRASGSGARTYEPTAAAGASAPAAEARARRQHPRRVAGVESRRPLGRRRGARRSPDHPGRSRSGALADCPPRRAHGANGPDCRSHAERRRRRLSDRAGNDRSPARTRPGAACRRERTRAPPHPRTRQRRQWRAVAHGLAAIAPRGRIPRRYRAWPSVLSPSATMISTSGATMRWSVLRMPRASLRVMTTAANFTGNLGRAARRSRD